MDMLLLVVCAGWLAFTAVTIVAVCVLSGRISSEEEE